MATGAFTENIQRHVACPETEAEGATVREVLERWGRPLAWSTARIWALTAGGADDAQHVLEPRIPREQLDSARRR